jgi:hypothetical protein
MAHSGFDVTGRSGVVPLIGFVNKEGLKEAEERWRKVQKDA